MRFLNTSTLQFHQVPDSELHLEGNKYAILSHRWGADEDEVSYGDILSLRDLSNKQNFAKIKGFCKLAASKDCRYGWVDTCCINEGNSSELAETINSMYQWYENSHICVVYLVDVCGTSMTESEWFNRGWTLQELIAPKEVYFYDQQWKLLGTKTELLTELASKTSIPAEILSHATEPSTCSIAQRMSWAAKRMTTRVEDRAYSLMGLFDVYMPMIYGEREKAFVRLQQHIIQKCKDESMFAWPMESLPGAAPPYSGLYAPSPSVYLNCDQIIPTPGSQGFSETNGELHIKITLRSVKAGTYLARLNCINSAYPDCYLAITIAKTSNTPRSEFVSVMDHPVPSQTHYLEKNFENLKPRQVRVPVDPRNPPVTIFNGFWLRTLEPPNHPKSQITILSDRPTSDPDYVYNEDMENKSVAIVRIKSKSIHDRPHWSEIRWLKFKFAQNRDPFIWLANDSQSKHLEKPFARAIASQESGVRPMKLFNAWFHDQRICELQKTDRLHYGWPEGRTWVRVDRYTGLHDCVIHELGLKISVQLLPFCKPSMVMSESAECSVQPITPTMVWTVDITEVEKKDAEYSCYEFPWSDFCGPCCHGGMVENEYEAEKQRYADHTRLQIPWIGQTDPRDSLED